MKKFTLLILLSLFLSTGNVRGTGIDSLNLTSSFITLGDTWYTDYFTNYYVYTNYSFFKDENGGLHAVFISNYELYYCNSMDGGVNWETEQIVSTHDGDFKEAVIYVNEDGKPFIAATVNPYFDYGNPTGISYGDEFRYSVYYFYQLEGNWVEEEVYNSTLDPQWSGNYGIRVNELYQNLEGEMVLMGSRYGWYTYGGQIWEFVRGESEWQEPNLIQNYSDTPVDHATEVSRSYLKDDGTRYIMYSRPYNASGILELVYIHNTDGSWSEPTLLTNDMINHSAWDISISSDQDLYLIHYSNDPAPHINMMTDFEESVELNVDLSMVDTIQAAKIHITKDNILDLLVYPFNTDTVILFASEDFGTTWSDPMYLQRKDFPGVLPNCDQFSDQGSDLEFIRVTRVSSTEPYGPDSLFYNHIEQINTTALGIADYEKLDPKLSVYPNPFSDIVTINFLLNRASELSIRIYNLHGKVVYDESYQGVIGENRIQEDLSDLDSGSYIIEVIETDNPDKTMQRSSLKVLKLTGR
jgi:hypothetical protein